MKGKLKYLLFIAAMFVCGFMTAPNVFAATLHQKKHNIIRIGIIQMEVNILGILNIILWIMK